MEEFVRDGDEYVVDGYWRIRLILHEETNPHEAALFQKFDERAQELISQGKTEEEAYEIVNEEQAKLMGELDKIPQNPLTIDELQQSHLLYKQKFEDSDEWKSLKTHLRAEQRRGLKITKIVGLGLGSCENNAYGSVEGKSLQRETALLSALMSFFDIKVCISQDPVFEAVDKAFLELLGHKIVDDPGAFEVTDEETFVWADHSNGNVFDSIAKGVHPAALLCRNLSVHPGPCLYGNPGETREDLERRMVYDIQELRKEEAESCSPRKMIQGYSTWDWSSPVLKTGELVMYTKKDYDEAIEGVSAVSHSF